jgi:signal transduction histidine kinase
MNILRNELKYKTTIVRSFAEIPLIFCYPQQLNQVIMNLLVNAAQAIETQGTIEIVTRHIDDFVELIITDTGQGIPEKNLTKIFDPFFTTKPVGKGTGLGLNVVYNIIKKHKGEIQVESTLGKGTTFTITLPINPEL